MKLLHYSDEPFVFSRDHEYRPTHNGKPTGFWVSVEGDDDWRNWCESENFGDIGSARVYEVALSTQARILRVGCVAELDALHNRIAKGRNDYRPDWSAVMREYDGLIIAPYMWDRRLDYMWYYGWDCASGVIWNLHAVAHVREIDPPVMQPPSTSSGDVSGNETEAVSK